MLPIKQYKFICVSKYSQGDDTSKYRAWRYLDTFVTWKKPTQKEPEHLPFTWRTLPESLKHLVCTNNTFSTMPLPDWFMPYVDQYEIAARAYFRDHIWAEMMERVWHPSRMAIWEAYE